MHTVVYVSSATELFSDQELIALLEKSRANNAAVEVTGMLLYRDGNFMQLLEGSQTAVDGVLKRIQTDIRHRGIIKLIQEETTERNFGDWSMGFKKLDKNSLYAFPGYSDFLSQSFTADSIVQNPSKAMSLLLNFKKLMR